jgi:hypothetical protein
MSELRMKLESLLKKIGIAHLVPDGSDEKLHSWVCQLLCVDKVSNLSFQHLNEISASLDFIVKTNDKQQIYNIISSYENEFLKNK